MKKSRKIPDTGASGITIQSTLYKPTNSTLLGQQKYQLTTNTTPSNILNYTRDSNNTLLIKQDGSLNKETLIQTINQELIYQPNKLKTNGNPRIIQITRTQSPDNPTIYYTYILIPILNTGNTDTLQTFCQAHNLTFGEYNCEILLNDINIPDNEIITKQNILRMQVIKDIGFKAHPENLYRAIYTSSGLNQTTLSITMPKLNYYQKEGQLKYHDLKLLLIPSNKQITYGDGTTLDQNTILTYINASDCYLSQTSITPELFDTQEKECHLITFNKKIPNGTYKAVLLQPDGTTYKLFEEFPKTINATSQITITNTKPNLTNHTTITPKTINTQTLKLETLQKGKITITINTDYFTGKTFSSSDGKRKIRRWIKIMKGTQTILPKTQITTTYDDNGNLITEIKEDYDNNKISITFPEYYLTGSTQMPTQKPQLQQGEYKILIYQTSTATTPLTQKPINLIQMPFNLTFYHHDHLGTTRYITNENGEILHTTDTLAYGEELTSPYENDKDEVLNTITYTGHEKDYETGLTYMLARYYSQGYGRFLSPDPGYDYDQLDPMSWNLYAYVRGNPIVKIDPLGLELTDAEKEKLEKLYKAKAYKKLDKEIRKIIKDRIKQYNRDGNDEEVLSTVVDLRVNGYLQYIDWSKVSRSVKGFIMMAAGAPASGHVKDYGETREGAETGERVCNNTQTYVATPLVFMPGFSRAGQGVYFAAGLGKLYYATEKAKLDPNNENKKNLELTRVQLGLAAFVLAGTYTSAATLPSEGAAMYKKSVDIFSAIIDTAFGIVEQQTQDKKRE